MFNWKLIGKSALLVTLALTSTLVYSAPDIKQAMIDTRVMRFPKMQLDGITYKSLRAEYVVEGKIAAIKEVTRSEMIDCGEPTAHSYTEVTYRGPTVRFRVVDGRQNKVVYRTEYVNEGNDTFDAGRCDAAKKNAATFEDQKQAWLAEIQDAFLKDTRAQMDRYLQVDAALRYADVRFPFFYVADGGSRFASFNEAFDASREAFDINMETGITVDALGILKKAAKQFERALVENGDAASAFDLAFKRAAHQNLSAVYFMMGNFDYARRHDARAVSSGLPADESLQKLILEHERRQIFSPKVAANVVLTANLYRVSESMINNLVIQQVSLYEYNALK